MKRIDKLNDYDGFVEKFKPKKTTDDCYTPPKVYEAVKNWAVEEYKLHGVEIYRPFYPGGDYENFKYNGGVVIDNPPFSILRKIIHFYDERGIKYFLFAPHLTLFSGNVTGYIITDNDITYENGARVTTAFISNLEESHIRTAPKLRDLINQAQERKNKLPRYEYPKNVLTATRMPVDAEIKIKKEECYFIRRLDAKKKYKKGIFGSGFLISDSKADEIKQLKKIKTKDADITWELSDREKEIIKTLAN